MSLPTLEEFLKGSLRNSYIDEPGFKSLYVRKGPRYIEGQKFDNVFQIARVEAEKKGEGVFSKLIEKLKNKNLSIYIESILNPRLPNKLENLGFKKVDKNNGENYFYQNKEGKRIMSSENELIFTSGDEALQYLADLTGKTIKVAEEK